MGETPKVTSLTRQVTPSLLAAARRPPPMADGPAIHFQGVVKHFKDVVALDGLSFSVPKGQVFGLLGPNGSGKTTAIRILVGLDRADSGSVRALGVDAPDRLLNTRIGYMPQETA